MDPLSLFDHAFMRHALLAGAFAGVCCSLAGVFAVLMRLSFIGVCLAHAAFAGGLLAMVLGGDPLLGSLFLSLGSAAVIGPMADRGNFSPDTAVGIVFSTMLGAAILCIGLLPGSRAEALGLFWGNILTVSTRDVWLLGATALTAIAALGIFFKEIQAVACHRDIAAAAGLPATAIFYAILCFTGVTVTACLPSVGGLLVYSLIINPAAAAYQLTYSLRRMFLLAAVFGVVSSEAGLLFSYAFDLPAGASIVLTSSVVFVICAAFSPKRANRHTAG
ncbi:MAG: cation ABC transporter permease [Desulfovibrionaceae bacterium CG1_02_65_16]|nr:MAG: cation ABC transporter permease [Desulfovibrionaceae bacterium CG1_02_65_16]